MLRQFARRAMKSVFFTTDAEGNANFLSRCLQGPTACSIKRGRLQLNAADIGFVYGGDFGDKGPASIRIGRLLIEAKKRYPKQVALLAGNREIKMLRMKEELDPSVVVERLLSAPAAFWNETQPPSLSLVNAMKAQGLASGYDKTRFVSELPIETCQLIYLRWMLKHTMGCGPIKPGGADTFELWRQELASERPQQTISDLDVLDAFLTHTAKDGLYANYLRAAKLSHREGDTLFVHGAITEENLGYIPSNPERETNVTLWLEKLNHWYQQQLDLWDKRAPIGADQPPGSSDLARYVLFDKRSIVTTNWYNKGRLAPVSGKVTQALNAVGIKRVVTGHQPFNDFPLILRSKTLEVIVGDTGYSDPTQPDNRGKAAHRLCLRFENGKSEALIDATRRTGKQQSLALNDEAYAHLGQFDEQGNLISVTADGEYIGLQLDGFQILETNVLQLATGRPCK